MKWIKCFIYSAGAILLAAASERFIVAAGDAQSLSLLEPVLGIPFRYALLFVGGVELVAALISLFGRQTGLQLGSLAWLATNYAIYWICLLTNNIHPQATCIGSLTDPLHFSRGTMGFTISLAPIYLLLGSYTALLWLWFGAGRAALPRSQASEFSKMSCPSCGIHIRFDDHNLGQKISCPHCQKAIALRRDENLKMSCFFCSEHIEFPSHALGQKLKCPHCDNDITLKEPSML